MPEWMVHLYVKVPAVLKVWTNLVPCEHSPESKLPLSAVTVCELEASCQSHSTAWPALMLTDLGSKAPIVLGSATIFTIWAAVAEAALLALHPPPPPPPVVLSGLPPQAASNKAQPRAAAIFHTLTFASFRRSSTHESTDDPLSGSNGGAVARRKSGRSPTRTSRRGALCRPGPRLNRGAHDIHGARP